MDQGYNLYKIPQTLPVLCRNRSLGSTRHFLRAARSLPGGPVGYDAYGYSENGSCLNVLTKMYFAIILPEIGLFVYELFVRNYNLCSVVLLLCGCLTINDVKQAIINFRATFKKIFCQFLRIYLFEKIKLF